jgi:hypothetical protein
MCPLFRNEVQRTSNEVSRTLRVRLLKECLEDFCKSAGNPEEIHLDCGHSSGNISGAWELIQMYVQTVENTTENISESATDNGLNRVKASSQSPDGGYLEGRRMAIRMKSRIVQDKERLP